jgi:hypothetical protein
MDSAIDFASADGVIFGAATASFSSIAPTRNVRCRVVSAVGTRSSGRNSDSSVRARR